MNLRRNLATAVLMTVVTTVIFGIAYPLVVTALAQALFPRQANGQLIVRDGRVIGSRLIGQAFSSPGYFHGRPSAAGVGYDATASNGSQLGPTSRALRARVRTAVAEARRENPTAAVPIDLVTASASGLDPDVSPEAARFQIARVARARQIPETELRALVDAHVQPRQLGVFGEARVNVLELNLAVDARWPTK